MSNSVTSSPSLNPKSSFLKIRPKELVYHPPFMGVITNELKLYNSSDEHTIAFKVKTTAPIRYCVRPNTGIIPPGKSIDVQILLNCTKDSPSISMKTKDKFQILSIVVTDPNIDPKLIWINSPPNLITKNKLKAVFSLPSNEQSPNISSNSGNSTNDYKSNSTLFSEVNNINNTQKHDHEISSNSNIDINTNSSNNNNSASSLNATSNRSDSRSLKELTKRITQSTSSSIQDTETEKLRNQLKNLNDELEKIKKGNITTTNVTQAKGGFNHYQTLMVIFAIAVLSFIFGKLI
ncbi:hypothetical protein ACTA71_009675 [Dictyostelium dimigraforme]